MKKTRKNGFYWVKDNSQWRVGEWMPDMEIFKLTNGGHYSIGVLDEIDETPITRSQFKVKPGLTLEQVMDEVAKTIYWGDVNQKFENWQSFMNSADFDYLEKMEALEKAYTSHTASLTSEIKGLREENERLKEKCYSDFHIQDIKTASYEEGYEAGYENGVEAAQNKE